MILLKRNYQWTLEDSKKDEYFSFFCPGQVKEIRILFSYAPDSLQEEKKCVPLIQKAIEKYYGGREPGTDTFQVLNMYPLKNLITLSLSKEEVYLGNAHRWEGPQIHHLSAREVSPGFVCPQKIEGKWEGMLHLHAVCTAVCKGILVVEGRTDDEMVSS